MLFMKPLKVCLLWLVFVLAWPGSLLAQDPGDPLAMTLLGAWLHAAAGDRAAAALGRGLCASDLSDALGPTWARLEGRDPQPAPWR